MLQTAYTLTSHTSKPNHTTQSDNRTGSGVNDASHGDTSHDRVGKSTTGRYTCKNCNTGFYPVNKAAKYCSSSCRQAAHRRRHNPKPKPKRKHCKHCRSAFTPKHSNHKFCCVQCRTLSHRHKRRSAIKTYSKALQVSLDKALDIADIAGIAALVAALDVSGYGYDYKLRQWTQSA